MSEKRNAAAVIITEGVPWLAGQILYQVNGDGEIDGMLFGCPCGCRAVHGAAWGQRGPWKWNGSIDRPTVRESLGCYPGHNSPVGPDGTFHWHGYLTDGRFEEC